MDEGVACRVLGWKNGEFFFDVEPAFFDAENLEELVCNSFCGPNLSKYLIQEMSGDEKLIALMKPCDSYSFNQLCTEHRIDRDKVYVIGVGCRGKIDIDKISGFGLSGITAIEEDEAGGVVTVHTLYGTEIMLRKNILLDKCMACKGKEHRVADEIIGESEDTASVERFDMVKRLEAMSEAERFAFWRGELSKCIRCNACRNVCPACSCVKCVFDNPDTGVQNKAAADSFEENMFHIIRAFHVAGRCTDCGECSRVCPQGIPLHLLNRKFISDIDALYGDYQAGESVDQRHPLIDYTQGDCEPSIVRERGGANA